MHQSGARMKTVHYRDDKVVGGSEIEHYDFDYQDVTYRNEVAKAGDSFTTTCWYDHTARGDERVRFGLGSADEMCIDFIGYWPRDALSTQDQYCGHMAGGTFDKGEAVNSLGRTFGIYVAPPATEPTTSTATTATSITSTTTSSSTTRTTITSVADICSDSPGCGDAGPCFSEQGCQDGKRVWTGMLAACAPADVCASCFPDSPCGARVSSTDTTTLTTTTTVSSTTATTETPQPTTTVTPTPTTSILTPTPTTSIMTPTPTTSATVDTAAGKPVVTITQSGDWQWKMASDVDGVVSGAGDFPTLTVKQGTTIRFVGTVLNSHNFAVKRVDDAGLTLDVVGPSKIAGDTAVSYAFTWTAAVAGTYEYYCQPHSSFMKGALVVKEKAAAETAETAEPTPAPTSTSIPKTSTFAPNSNSNSTVDSDASNDQNSTSVDTAALGKDGANRGRNGAIAAAVTVILVIAIVVGVILVKRNASRSPEFQSIANLAAAASPPQNGMSVHVNPAYTDPADADEQPMIRRRDSQA